MDSKEDNRLRIGVIVPLDTSDSQVVLDCLFMLRGFFKQLEAEHFCIEICITKLTPTKNDINEVLQNLNINKGSCAAIVCIGDSLSYLVSEICGEIQAKVPILGLACSLDLPDGASPYTYRIWPLADKIALSLRLAIVEIKKTGLALSKIYILRSNEGSSYEKKYENALRLVLNDFAIETNNYCDVDVNTISDDSLIILIGYGLSFYSALDKISNSNIQCPVITENFLAPRYYSSISQKIQFGCPTLNVSSVIDNTELQDIKSGSSNELFNQLWDKYRCQCVNEKNELKENLNVPLPICDYLGEVVGQILSQGRKKLTISSDTNSGLCRIFEKFLFFDSVIGPILLQPLGSIAFQCDFWIFNKIISELVYDNKTAYLLERADIELQEFIEKNKYPLKFSTDYNSFSVKRILISISKQLIEYSHGHIISFYEMRGDISKSNFFTYPPKDFESLTTFLHEQNVMFDNQSGYGLTEILSRMDEPVALQNNISVIDFEENDALRIFIIEKYDQIMPLWIWIQKNIIDENGEILCDWQTTKFNEKINGAVIAKTSGIALFLWKNKERFDSDDFLLNIRQHGGIVFIKENSSRNESESQYIVNNLSSIKEIIKDNIALYNYKRRKSQDIAYDYMIPISDFQKENGVLISKSCIFLTTKKRLSYLDIRIITNVITHLFEVFHRLIYLRSMLIANTKSALVSIMSRNGSHNIGSHVLASLSHNVATMPDDQVLYRYIQHRMDYIATATTDRPTWCQPTMFVGEMMKNFLSQRHLLNNISISEGLKAWEFQSDRAKSERGGRIKFHIRKVDGNGKSQYDFIKYIQNKQRDDKKLESIDFSYDVSLAIPGGCVGQHAFFTIIENIIRNAAKHDWSTTSKSTAKLKNCSLEDSQNSSTGDLDIYIDFEDNPEREYVLFTIWTRLSDVFDGVDKCNNHEEDKQEFNNEKYKLPCDQEVPLEPNDIRAILKSDKEIKGLPLHWRQQVKLAKSFITDQGDLRRENWGLAEMKISAGYLQNAEIEDIGGISDSDARYRIIVPCCVDDSRANDEKLNLDVKHLGYQFTVPKAKQILFVVSQKPKALPDIESELRQYGIYVKTREEVSKDTTSNYAYVVVDKFPENNEMQQYPFRILAMTMPTKEEQMVVGEMQDVESDSMEEAIQTNATVTGEMQDVELDNIQPVLNKAQSCEIFLQEVIENKGDDVKKDKVDDVKKDKRDDVKKIAQKLIEVVCERWLCYLKDIRQLKSSISVYIKTDGDNEGAGKCLVTDLDIVEYAFNEGIEGALKAFLKIGKNADDVKLFVNCLLSLKEPERNLLVFDRKRELYLVKQSKINNDTANNTQNSNINKNPDNDAQNSSIDFSREAIIKRQLSYWLTEWRKININIDVDNAINYLNGLSSEISNIENQIKDLENEYSSYSDDSYHKRHKDLKKKLSNARKALHNPISFLVDYLLEYCEQIYHLICKYAENIATLPEGFSKIDGVNQHKETESWDIEWANIHFWKDKIPEQTIACTKQSETKMHNIQQCQNQQIRYWRHETKRKTGQNGEDIDLYLEGLSGTQSYLSVLERFTQNDRFLQTRLVENALLRILIIDERTRDFLEKHPSIFSKFEAQGIFVANDKKAYDDCEKLMNNIEVPESKEEITDNLVNLDPHVLKEIRTRKRQGHQKVDSDKIKLIEEVHKNLGKKYEILIIHQGIIDKWLPSHSENDVAIFLESLERIFRYVVITTGRGTPANIPKFGRVLPFSTIQTSLFCQYPEKLLLTDAIMNILPVKGGNNAQA